MSVRKTCARMFVLGLAVSGTMLLSPGLASAAVSDGYVDGSAAIADDLDDEATLCNGCSHSHSNYAGVWQMILAVDYEIGADGNSDNFNSGHVDCSFGPETKKYTINWQRANGLPQTGKLDAATRHAAGARLTGYGESDGSGGDYIYYAGDRDATIKIHRRSRTASAPKRWDVLDPYSASDWQGASYSSVSFATC